MLAGLLVVAALLAATAAALFVNRVPLTAPPGIAERLALYLTRNVAQVSPQSRFPELRSPRYRLPAGELTVIVATLATRLGYQEVSIDDTRRRVSAVAVSSLFGFRDDLEVVVQADGDSTVLLARSASRRGRADFGANQDHLRRLLQALDEHLAANR